MKYFKKDFIKRLAEKFKFCDGDINKFCLMLTKMKLSIRIYE